MLYDTHTDMSLLFPPFSPSQGERPEQKSEEGSDQINAKSDMSPQKKKKNAHIDLHTLKLSGCLCAKRAKKTTHF